ncbi:helix-turn-helix transcriptional regulator [Endozoicomonas atrinae]|uniref:helix-turn-helix transcriptional regulator n=1 Tax=Endozoicomonas atrinae TaxID=1333660 RepID=UPI003B00149D
MKSNQPKHPTFLRKGKVVDITGLSPSTLERLIKQGLFPKPTYLHEKSRIPLWLDEVVYQWMRDMADQE